jgi:hypothetical protein
MLGATFFIAFDVYQVYFALAKNNFSSTSADFIPSLNSLVQAAIVVMFLGIMGWVGSSFLLRGVEFMKIDKGVGIVTFKVDKGVGVVSGVEVIGKSTQQVLEVPPQLEN